MAFTADIMGFEAGLIRRMRNDFDRSRVIAGKRRLYRDMIEEFHGPASASDDREAAWGAVHGK
jgi:hypothetical protein